MQHNMSCKCMEGVKEGIGAQGSTQQLGIQHTQTEPQLEEQNSQKQLDSRRYEARRTTPWLEVQNNRHDSIAKQLEIHNSSGHRAWEDVVAIHSS
ncbi:hypothetical protein F511_26083 [Dorcoceras hygrometricum]|uniref:Uncharacterized protein n=1 Tax=Dorcoceras hygrometricum TaxID=472368 RepID=A0A2Z7DHH5_9LAMI|nr:hypothetical protein F511_26083 [Dorcoceras hygrometricum]